ncbi:MAG TPA: hypothetical protein VFI28_13820 [Candidatus Limnocylindrales bacterium]|nr:hypothetical protein [Candidatus Limnocylindrales bacterium]
MTRRPSVRVVVHDPVVPRWAAQLVESLVADWSADVVVPERTPGTDPGRTNPAITAYRRADARVFGRSDDPTVPVRLGRRGAAAGSGVQPSAGRPRGGADVTIELGIRPTDAALPQPNNVVWQLRQASLSPAVDPSVASSDADVADVLTRTVVAITELVDIRPDGMATALRRIVSSSDPLSARRGGRDHFPKVTAMVLNALRDMAIDGRLHPAPPLSVPDDRGAGRWPQSTPRAALAIGRVAIGYVARRVGRLGSRERWFVAIHDEAPAATGKAIVADPHATAFRLLQPPSGREWADPFLVAGPNGPVLFAEEWVRSRGRARIVVLDRPGDGSGATARPVLDLDQHVSYPFVFEWQNDWYLLPQRDGESLELYRAARFPDSWRWDRTLLAERAADATLVEHDGRWWLFTARPGPGGRTADELHVYIAASPLGPWRAHPRNPVVSDVRTARPGGAFFRHAGRLYRPAQDGGPTYGYALVVMRVDRLDEDGYAETCVQRIEPTWRPRMIATHTLNSLGELTVIDAAIREPRRPLPRRGART